MKQVFLSFLLLVFAVSTNLLASAYLTVPVANMPAQSAAQLYTKQCASCHGKDGRSKTIKGKLKHARNLTDRDWQDQVSDERIAEVITGAKGDLKAGAKQLVIESNEAGGEDNVTVVVVAVEP